MNQRVLDHACILACRAPGGDDVLYVKRGTIGLYEVEVDYLWGSVALADVSLLLAVGTHIPEGYPVSGHLVVPGSLDTGAGRARIWHDILVPLLVARLELGV